MLTYVNVSITKGSIVNAKNKDKDVTILQDHLQNALNDIRKRLVHVQKKYSVSYNSIRDYLDINEPYLLESMDMLEKECDGDIFSQVITGSVTKTGKKEWTNLVIEWKEFILNGLGRFENYVILSQVA